MAEYYLYIAVVILGYSISPTLTANVAASKFANQTGVQETLTALKAVDGERDDPAQAPEYYKTVCATVDNGDPASPAQWFVDLGATYTVHAVTVWNTYQNVTGAAADMQYFGAYVISADGTETTCGVYRSANPVPPGDSVTFPCSSGTSGKYVRIEKLAAFPNKHKITLCEVEVEDQPISSSTMPPTTSTTSQPMPPNIALNKPTNQSGTYMNNPSWSSDHAVDGLYDYPPSYQMNLTYCARIDSIRSSQPAEWWVDLQTLYVVQSVTVTNALWDGAYFRMKNFRIDVIRPGHTDAVCGENTAIVGQGSSVRLLCPSLTVGRYVRFLKTGLGSNLEDSIRRVSLCEVEVAGELYAPIANYTNQPFSVNSVTNTHMFVEWGQLETLPGRERFYGYDLVYWPSENISNPVTQSLVFGTTSWNITGLPPNTEYIVDVRPYRQYQDGSKEYGQYYPQQTVKTTCEPDAPLRIDVQTDLIEDLIKITYELPESTGLCNNITAASVRYRRRGLIWSETDAVPAVTNSTIPVPTLTSGTYTYELQLVLTNDLGYNRVSDIPEVAIIHTTATPTTVNGPVTGGSTGGRVDSRIAIIAGTVVGGVVLLAIIIAVIVLIYRRKKTDKENGQGPTFARMEPVPVVVSGPATRRSAAPPECQDSLSSIDEVPFMSAPVAVLDLEKYVARRKEHINSLIEEFASLPGPRTSLCTVAEHKDNKSKNRYLGIYPYDKTRVVLHKTSGNKATDYINANYIEGYNGLPRRYIATQGPRLNTLHEFWRMVWQENSHRIVMVANLVEGTKTRAEQYWASDVGSVANFGDFSVTLEAESHSADYVRRTLTVQHKIESRSIQQFHFTTWPDKSNPAFGPLSLVTLWRKVRSFDSLCPGPMVVHCSAGVGRTGTFIALDILADQANAENHVDIYGVVHKLRNQRMNMVQTKDQYIFLHDTLVEHVKYGDTSYPSSGFPQYVSSHLATAPNGAYSKIDRQHQVLRKILIPKLDNEDSDGMKPENHTKNRDLNILPDDNARPHLITPSPNGNNYINAVLVDSYKRHHYYVATQLPLQSTVSDFWRLVYDHSCHTIIMLNSIKTDDPSSEEYWPDEDEQSVDHGPLTVSLVRESLVSERIIVRDFTVHRNSQARQGQAHSVRQYQLLDWPQEQVLPTNELDLLDLLEHAAEWQWHQDKANKLGEVIVQCYDGRGASGIYCGVSYILDRIRAEQDVDVFTAARFVARTRHEFFANLDEYQVLYHMAVAYLERYRTVDSRASNRNSTMSSISTQKAANDRDSTMIY